MSAGYSGTPLVRKLGLKSGMSCVVLDPPEHYRQLLVGLPDGVKWIADPDGVDFVHLFVQRRAGLGARLRQLRSAIAQDGMIWVSWPKKTAGVATDVTEDVVREAALAVGLVDVKVCAVDEIWSGLKLVIPRADRH